MGGLIRTNLRMDLPGFVRGPAMIYSAPLSQAPPDDIGDIVRLSGTETDEQQTLTLTGTPSGGAFQLGFKGLVTGPIAYNATAAAVVAALEELPTVGAGNVTATGGPLPTAVVLTFTKSAGKQAQPLMTLAVNDLSGGTTPTATIVETTPGVGLFDPLGSWVSLGATRDGINPTYNNEEETFTMDQKTSIVGSAPTIHNWNLTTTLQEVNLSNLALVCDMGPVTLNVTPDVPELRMGMGAPASYTPRRLAVVHRRPAQQGGLLRAHFWYLANRGTAEVTLPYSSTGPNQGIAASFTGLVDDTISDEYSAVGYILEQVAY